MAMSSTSRQVIVHEGVRVRRRGIRFIKLHVSGYIMMTDQPRAQIHLLKV